MEIIHNKKIERLRWTNRSRGKGAQFPNLQQVVGDRLRPRARA